jgi:hypothetical protein
MALRRTLKFIFSLLAVFSWLGLNAQKQEWNGITLGADLSRFVVPFIDSTRFGWEFSGDYEIINDLFLVAELGSETTNLNTRKYDYKLAGGYTRIGIDYNFMKHVAEDSPDKMLIGLRYGFTTFYHQAQNIEVWNDYWGDVTGGKVDRNWLTANWVEIATGMRTRLFNNFYLGWSVRMRVKLGVSNDPTMSPYTIPGYGKPWNNTWLGVNYSLCYKIPIYKKGPK